MLRKVFIIMAIVALAGSGLALAQGKTDLSGSYTFDEAKSDPAPAGGGGRGGRGGGVASALSIKQTAAEITIERTTGRGPQTATYKVGGESTITQGRGEAKATTKWDGDKLVIDSTQSMGDMTITRKEVYSLAGSVLTVETTTTTPNGTQTRKLVYNKNP